MATAVYSKTTFMTMSFVKTSFTTKYTRPYTTPYTELMSIPANNNENKYFGTTITSPLTSSTEIISLNVITEKGQMAEKVTNKITLATQKIPTEFHQLNQTVHFISMP